MMRIVVDLQSTQNGSRARGIGRCARNLLPALVQRDDLEVFALLNTAFEETLAEDRSFAERIVGADRLIAFKGLRSTAECESGNRGRRAFSEAMYESLLSWLDFDALCVPSLFEGLDDNSICSLKGAGTYRRYVVVHDVIPLTDPDRYLGGETARAWYAGRLAHLLRADAAMCVSESARKELLRYTLYPREKAAAIGSGIEQRFLDAGTKRPSSAPLRQINRPFILHASAIDQRKNFEGLIRAFAMLPRGTRSKHQLVLAGKGADSEIIRLKQVCRESGLQASDVVFTGYIEDSKLIELYSACKLFVFPSFHEGFGLPVLEAMACGAPTIGSAATSIPEVIGREDLLFDPHDPAGMSRLIGDLLRSDDRLSEVASYGRRRAAQFRWSDVASRARNIMGRAEPKAERVTREAIAPSLDQLITDLRFRLNGALGGVDLGEAANAIVANFDEQVRIATIDRSSWPTDLVEDAPRQAVA